MVQISKGGWKIKSVKYSDGRISTTQRRPQFNARFSGQGSIRQYVLSFTGEKSLGEMGPIRKYIPDYEALRSRSWQCYLDSDVAQFTINKFMTWVIGEGLKLQSEPKRKVLEMEKISLDVNKFSEQIEAYFSTFSESNNSTYSRKRNLHHLESRAFVNSIIGGDVLVILRLEKGNVTVQLIDGGNVTNPYVGTAYYEVAKQNGNIIRDGIEFNSRGEHIAYYVRKISETDVLGYEVTRIEARNSAGLTMAYLVDGFEYRLDNSRSIPLLSAVMEKLKQLDRYQSATLGSAEERAKIAYTIEHEIAGTGEDPLLGRLAKIVNADTPFDDMPVDDAGNMMAQKVAASTNKQVFNLPNGSKLKSMEAKNELYFKDFFTININLVCAALEIPPNVAMSMYNDSFSASRAALKDWEHTLLVKRYNFACQFWGPIYALMMEVLVLKNKINAPGYLTARSKGNDMVVSAYRMARFVGANVPHIDPMKEVQAARAKLGPKGASLPLTTLEAATEEVNGGEALANLEQFSQELKDAEKLGFEPIVQQPDPANPKAGKQNQNE